MPPDKAAPGSPQDWLSRAKGDLALARIPLPEAAFYEDLCFHAQQAAGKAIKAVYLHHGWSFRYTHDLSELLAGLKDNGLAIPAEVDEAATLAVYAWESRYPTLGEPVDEEEYRAAVGQAETVAKWAGSIING